MKTITELRLFLSPIILACIALLTSCEKEDQVRRFPQTQEEKKESLKLSEQIGVESSKLIRAAFNEAMFNNKTININDLAKKINSIDGVLTAKPNRSGNAIIVQQVDSTYHNILIVTKDNDKLFEVTSTKSLNIDKKAPNIQSDFIMPYGSGRALILAPFQSSFNTDLEYIYQLLVSIGYKVDSLLNSHADLDHFRGNFLNNYDIVYISTHGSANSYSRGGFESTAILTGEIVNDATDDLLDGIEYSFVGTGKLPLGLKEYYALTVNWLQLTTDENFKNTWVFIDACESSKIDEGYTSLSDAFIKLGAEGYNGFDVSILIPIANKIVEKMFSEFCSGLSFTNASENVRNDPELIKIRWTILYILPLSGIIGDIYDVSTFDYKQSSDKPFYLIAPEVTDIDGNVYKTIKIGGQIWMAENLATTHYSDGSPLVNGTGLGDIFPDMTTKWYFAYNDDEKNIPNYGRLYTWAAVMNGSTSSDANPSGVQGVCPTSWHVPSDSEFKELEKSLGMSQIDADNYGYRGTDQGTQLKLNGGSGFNVLLSGVRGNYIGDNAFHALGEEEYLISSTTNYQTEVAVNGRNLRANIPTIIRMGYDKRFMGFAVRCVKD